MKKVILILVLMFAFMRPAHAVVPPPCPPCFASGATLASASTASIVGAMSGAFFVAVVFPYLNTTGEKPFEDLFTSVNYSYPQDKHFPVLTGKTFSSNGYGKPYHVTSRFGTDSIRSDND